MIDWASTGCIQDGVATLQCIPVAFGNILYWAIGLAGIAAVFFIIFSGIKFLTSGGDPKQVEGARKTMTYAIIGLILIIAAYSIIVLIGFMTRATCISASPFLQFGNCP